MLTAKKLCRHSYLRYSCESAASSAAYKKSLGTKNTHFLGAVGGFTLLELIITILLIAILSAFAIPRLLTTPAYSAQSLADQMISHLQQAQVQALNHRSGSYCVGFSALKYGLPSNCAAGLNNADSSYDLPRATTIQLGATSTFQINFDFLGRPVGADCDGGCQLQVIANETVNVCVEREGYVHTC